MRKILKTTITLLLIFWLLALPLRSLLYIFRIIKEFTNPPQNKYNYIKPCLKPLSFNSVEEERVYNYKTLGEKCKE